jgi:hypothetical protein
MISTSTDVSQLNNTASKLAASGISSMIMSTRDLFLTHFVKMIIQWLGEIPTRFRSKTLKNLDPDVQLDLIILRIVCNQLFSTKHSKGVLLTTKNIGLDAMEKSDLDLWKMYKNDINRESRLDSLVVLNFKLFLKQRTLMVSFLNQTVIAFPEHKEQFVKHLVARIGLTSLLRCDLDRWAIIQVTLYCNLFPVS